MLRLVVCPMPTRTLEQALGLELWILVLLARLAAAQAAIIVKSSKS